MAGSEGGVPGSAGGASGAGGTASCLLPYRCSTPRVLKASNANTGDDFGYSLAVEGDVLVVGAFDEDSDGVGVGPVKDPGSSSIAESGAAYVYRRQGEGWVEDAFLKAPQSMDRLHFGVALALELPWLVVSAPDQDGGRAHFFERAVEGYWTQGPTVQPDESDVGDDFGRVLALRGDTLVVSAWYEGSSATGVDGDQLNNSAIKSGAVYVFERSGGVWAQAAYLKASNTGESDIFGCSLAFDGNTIAVGARREDSADQGTLGLGEDEGAPDSGAVYIFERYEASWVQTAYLKSSNSEAGDMFGYSLALSGDTLVVASRYEDSRVGAGELDNNAKDSGAVYVFDRVGGEWVQTAFLKASNADASDFFGSQVALSGNLLAVSATFEAGPGNTSAGSGAVYLFERDGSTWHEVGYFKAPQPGQNDNFGIGLAFDDQTLAVGAIGEDSHPDGPPATASESGAAYVFR